MSLLYRYTDVAVNYNLSRITRYDESSYIYSLSDTLESPTAWKLRAHKLDKLNRKLTLAGEYDFGSTPITDLCTDGTYIYVFGGTSTSIKLFALSFNGSSFTLIDTYTLTPAGIQAYFLRAYRSVCLAGKVFFILETNAPATTYVYAFSFDGSILTNEANKDLGYSVYGAGGGLCYYGSYLYNIVNVSGAIKITSISYSSTTFTVADTEIYSSNLLAGIPATLKGYLYICAYSPIYTSNLLRFPISASGQISAPTSFLYTDYTEPYDAAGNFFSDGEFIYMKSQYYLYAYNTVPSLSLENLFYESEAVKSIGGDSRFIFVPGSDAKLVCYTFGRSAPNASCTIQYTESV